MDNPQLVLPEFAYNHDAFKSTQYFANYKDQCLYASIDVKRQQIDKLSRGNNILYADPQLNVLPLVNHPNGYCFPESLIVGDKLGEGSFGAVYNSCFIASNQQRNCDYVIKIIELNEYLTDLPSMINEVNFMKFLQNNGFDYSPKIYAAYICLSGGTYVSYIIQELAQGSPSCEPFESERVNVEHLKAVAQMFLYLWDNYYIMHGDAGCANIFITTDGSPMLIDYGFVSQYDNNGYLTSITDMDRTIRASTLKPKYKRYYDLTLFMKSMKWFTNGFYEKYKYVLSSIGVDTQDVEQLYQWMVVAEDEAYSRHDINAFANLFKYLASIGYSYLDIFNQLYMYAMYTISDDDLPTAISGLTNLAKYIDERLVEAVSLLNINKYTSLLYWGVYNNSFDAVSQALDNNASILDSMYELALQNNVSVDIFNLLITLNTNVNSAFLLQLAADYDNVNVVKYLLDRGVNRSVLNDSVLKWKSENSHAQVVNYLEGNIQPYVSPHYKYSKLPTSPNNTLSKTEPTSTRNYNSPYYKYSYDKLAYVNTSNLPSYISPILNKPSKSFNLPSYVSPRYNK